MLNHEYLVMVAPDYCKGADFILHTDSDCIFTEPVRPEDYLVDGKPVLLVKEYGAKLAKEHPEVQPWKDAVERAIGYCTHETMQRHPAVHHPKTYEAACMVILNHTGKSPSEYIRMQRNEFPQGFCEFNTLGNVALRNFKEDYHVIDLDKEPRPKDKIRQAWSHQPPTQNDMEAYRKAGLFEGDKP